MVKHTPRFLNWLAMMNLFMFRNSLNIFKGTLLQFVKPLENSVCTHHDAGGITYLAILRLRLGFSHLRYHKFKHGFCRCYLFLFTAVAQQSKILFITSVTAQTFKLREIAFSTKLQWLTDQLLTRAKSQLFKLFCMAIQLVLSMIAN